MEKDNHSEKDFKVEDRRTSSKGSGEEEAGPKPEPSDEEAPGKAGKEPGAGPGPKAEAGSVPRVDFYTFILSLFSSALIQLGDMADPITGTVERNPAAAKQTIDIIDILREKTAGNLTEEEASLLENAAAELKWKYLDAVKKKD